MNIGKDSVSGLLLGLEQGSRKHGGPQGPRCPEYQRASQFWQSCKTDEWMRIRVSY